MEQLRHVQVVLEQACERFQVIYVFQDVFFLTLLAAAARVVFVGPVMPCAHMLVPAGAQPEETGRRGDTALSSQPKAYQSLPVHPRAFHQLGSEISGMS